MPVKPRAPTTSWSYVIYPKGVNCFRSRVGGQTIMKLWEAELSAFHDGDLAQATPRGSPANGQAMGIAVSSFGAEL